LENLIFLSLLIPGKHIFYGFFFIGDFS